MDEKKLSQYIDDLNAGKKPKEHSSGLRKEDMDDQALFETVRKVRQLREVEYPDDLFCQRLINSLEAKEKPVRSQRKKYTLIRAASAAAILFLVAAYYLLPNKTSNMVYAMENAMKAVRAYHGILEVSETNELGETVTQSKREVWADKSGNYYIRQLEGVSEESVTANNGKQKWQLRPEEKTVYLLPAFPDDYRFTFEIGNEIEDAAKAQTVEVIGQEAIHGREATKLQITPDGGSPYFLWVDNETDLPLQKVSAMQNAIQIKAEYTSFELINEIPQNLLAYQVPDGYKEEDADMEQTVASLEEARELVGFMPELPGEIAEGYALNRIAVETDHEAVKLYYSAEDSMNSILLIQSRAAGELAASSVAILGSVNQNKAEIINSEPDRSIRWQEDGMEYCVLGTAALENLTVFAKGLSGGDVVIPVNTENTEQPQIKVEVDLSAEENEQKSVDAGHSPWKLDPAFVAQVFASLQLSPQGITGDYPIAYEDIEIIENNGIDAIAEIRDEKSIAKYVYLKRLVRQDDTGIWTVVGYDTDKK
ncbi:MAG: hypothetical protein QM657_13255 [Lacrimispora sp.]|uniref:LolA family protein n=1 Tax=Lacrimispora sp. TaxID=2719234 RepID=UPI0039E400F9